MSKTDLDTEDKKAPAKAGRERLRSKKKYPYFRIRGVEPKKVERLSELANERYAGQRGRADSASRLVREAIDALLQGWELPGVGVIDAGLVEAIRRDPSGLHFKIEPPVSDDEDGDSTVERIELRLRPGEFAAISAVAAANDSGVVYYLHSLVRAHLIRLPQLQGTELAAVRESNHLLRAIGRNLNQIAKTLNKSGSASLTSEYVAGIQAVVKAHTELVGDVLEANLERWDISNVE